MYVTPQIRRLIPHLRAHAHLTEALRDAAHGTAQTTCRQTASVKIQIVFMVKNRIQFSVRVDTERISQACKAKSTAVIVGETAGMSGEMEAGQDSECDGMSFLDMSS